MASAKLIGSALVGTVVLAGVLWTGRSLALAGGPGGTQAEESVHAVREAAAKPQAPAGPTAKATFSMYCYWTGEASLGLVPGVVSSRIGHFQGKEIVEVEYDPNRTDPGRLAESLRSHGGFYGLIVPDRQARSQAESFLPAGEIDVRSGEPRFIESKYSLKTQHPELYYLDLTEAQAIALNTWSYFGGKRPEVLTPDQEARLEKLRRRLAEDRSPSLEPERAGPGRERYRQELLAWLGE